MSDVARRPASTAVSERLRASTAFARTVVQTMITLASASLGLVAALAWNEAIRATIRRVFGEGESLPALYTYALFATILAVVVLLLLARLAARIGSEAVISREAEG